MDNWQACLLFLIMLKNRRGRLEQRNEGSSLLAKRARLIRSVSRKFLSDCSSDQDRSKCTSACKESMRNEIWRICLMAWIVFLTICTQTMKLVFSRIFHSTFIWQTSIQPYWCTFCWRWCFSFIWCRLKEDPLQIFFVVHIHLVQLLRRWTWAKLRHVSVPVSIIRIVSRSALLDHRSIRIFASYLRPIPVNRSNFPPHQSPMLVFTLIEHYARLEFFKITNWSIHPICSLTIPMYLGFPCFFFEQGIIKPFSGSIPVQPAIKQRSLIYSTIHRRIHIGLAC